MMDAATETFRMPSISPRALTLLAVLLGGTGGALVALRRAPPRTAQASCTPGPPATASGSRTLKPTRTTPFDAAPSASQRRAGPLAATRDAEPLTRQRASASDEAGSIVDALEAKLPAKRSTVLDAGLLCARGRATMCFQVAHAYAVGRGVRADSERARSFRWRGLNLLFKACYDKDPEACYALAHLYRTGEGLPKSAEQADGLIQHTRFLCSFNASPICAKLGDAGSADGSRQTR